MKHRVNCGDLPEFNTSKKSLPLLVVEHICRKCKYLLTEKLSRWLYLLVKLILFLFSGACKLLVFCLSVDVVSDQIWGPSKQPINGRRLVSQE